MEGLLRGEREFGVAAAGRAEVGDHEPASHRSATPGPISSITPAASRPGVIGSVGMARGPAALSPVPTVAGSACSMNMFWSKTGRQLTESQIRAAGREAPAGALLAGSGKVPNCRSFAGISSWSAASGGDMFCPDAAKARLPGRRHPRVAGDVHNA